MVAFVAQGDFKRKNFWEMNGLLERSFADDARLARYRAVSTDLNGAVLERWQTLPHLPLEFGVDARNHNP